MEMLKLTVFYILDMFWKTIVNKSMTWNALYLLIFIRSSYLYDSIIDVIQPNTHIREQCERVLPGVSIESEFGNVSRWWCSADCLYIQCECIYTTELYIFRYIESNESFSYDDPERTEKKYELFSIQSHTQMNQVQCVHDSGPFESLVTVFYVLNARFI